MVDESRRGSLGLALALGAGGGALSLLALSLPFLLVPAVSQLGRIPWMATPAEIARKAVTRARQQTVAGEAYQRSRPRLVDLGSGDGRIVVAAAEVGFEAVGVELNPVLLVSSYLLAVRAGVLSRVSFRAADFWSLDLSDVDVVTCFGVASCMHRLDAKLRREARPGTQVICFRFPLPDAVPEHRDGELFFYRIPYSDSGPVK